MNFSDSIPEAVRGRLVRDIPHGRPRGLHHVVANTHVQLVFDDQQHLLDSAQSAHKLPLLSLHLEQDGSIKKYLSNPASYFCVCPF